MTGSTYKVTGKIGLALTAVLALFSLSAASCDSGVWKRMTNKFDRQGKIVSIKGNLIEWTTAAHADEAGYGDELVFRPGKPSAECSGDPKDTGYGFTMTVETNMAGLEISDLEGKNLLSAPGENCFRETSPCEGNSGCPSHSILKSRVRRDGFGRPYFERTCRIDLGKGALPDYSPAQGEKFRLTVKAIGNEKSETRSINLYAVTERPQISDFRVDRRQVPLPGGTVRLHAGLRYATSFTLKDQDGKVIKENNRDVWSTDMNVLDLDLNIRKTTMLFLIARNPAGANQRSVLVKVL